MDLICSKLLQNKITNSNNLFGLCIDFSFLMMGSALIRCACSDSLGHFQKYLVLLPFPRHFKIESLGQQKPEICNSFLLCPFACFADKLSIRPNTVLNCYWPSLGVDSLFFSDHFAIVNIIMKIFLFFYVTSNPVIKFWSKYISFPLS